MAPSLGCFKRRQKSRRVLHHAASRLRPQKDLDEFFFAAEIVLSEKGHALDLPEDDRWAAGIYGRTRDHSAALRQGICETLMILAVHSNNLFNERLGIRVEAKVDAMIRRLLTPMTPGYLKVTTFRCTPKLLPMNSSVFWKKTYGCPSLGFTRSWHQRAAGFLRVVPEHLLWAQKLAQLLSSFIRAKSTLDRLNLPMRPVERKW